MKDLFETPENMPAELQAIFQRYAMRLMDGASYDTLKAMLSETLSVGFTFDYYLDAEPYGLRPTGTPLNALEGFEKELTDETLLTTNIMKTEKEFYECPVCNSHDTRQDYNYPETMRCCDECGADFIEETGEIILDPRSI